MKEKMPLNPLPITSASIAAEAHRADLTKPEGGAGTVAGAGAEPASVLPVQIFLWSDEVDRGFVEKTSAAIIVLLVFMLLMNGLAFYFRKKFERRW